MKKQLLLLLDYAEYNEQHHLLFDVNNTSSTIIILSKIFVTLIALTVTLMDLIILVLFPIANIVQGVSFY